MAGPPLRARLEARLQRLWRQRGPLARLLWPLAALFGALLRQRRARYLDGRSPARHPGLPTLVVGNCIVGGAGKTPTTLMLLQRLRAAGWRPGIVSRGHGRAQPQTIRLVQPEDEAPDVGDEPLLLRLRGSVPVAVGADRVAAAAALRAAHPELDLILADDGLQHLRLARDLELIVFDERGAGNGWLLPAGPLREPIDRPSTASQPPLILYTGGRPSTPLPGWTAERQLGAPLPLGDWWAGRPAPADGWARLRAGPRPQALAGIAAPQRFFDALAAAGLPVQGLPCADHAALHPLPWAIDCPLLLLTEKDAVKIRPERLAAERPGTAVWVVPLDLLPEPAFDTALAAALARLPAPRPLP